ncbi:MAG: YXWGXW repeat-containing protein [Chitinophagales bacterium]
MKNLMLILIGMVMVISISSCEGSYYVSERPAEVYYERPLAPGPGYVWIGGDWLWEGGRYAWHPGHWERPRSGHRWVEGHWQSEHKGWKWYHGHWD